MLSKQELYSFTKDLYKFFKKGHDYRFRKKLKYRGELVYNHKPHEEWHETDDIFTELDPRDELLSTMIHEYLHYRHPFHCETKILELEKALINQLSHRQIRNIIKRFAEVL